MRKFYPLLLMIIPLMGWSQLYVSSGSYVYSDDRVIFVNQQIDLASNGNLYLRNESQLLQGTTGTSSNSGSGKLSVFQEGTSDNFDYNYWCSPVGNSGATSGNEPFGITMLNMPTGVITSTPAVILGTSALDGMALPLSIAQRWIYKFTVSNQYAQWILAGAASSISAGEGFTMKGTSGTDGTTLFGVSNNPGSAQRYDFRGKPNDGNISVPVAADNLTLTGNPYPSALHVNAFLLDPINNSCTGIAYYWEQNKAVNSHFLTQYQGGYGTYSPLSIASSGIYVPATFDTYDGTGALNTTGTSSAQNYQRKYAPIGQGFMVKGLTTGSVLLQNQHREYYKESAPLSDFERQSNAITAATLPPEELSYFRLNAILNGQHTKQLALAFLPEATDGVDGGVDAESLSGADLPQDVYFPIADKEYVIQGVAFDVTKRIPFGLRCSSEAEFKFYVPEAVNFDENQAIYLYDGLLGTYQNIRNEMVEITLPAGTYDHRFEITFMDSALSVGDVQGGISVLMDNTNGVISISNPAASDIVSVFVFDMAGKLITSKKQLGNSQLLTVPLNGVSDGIYLARVETIDGTILTRKIAVHPSKQ